jgi:hypothetical protein
MTRMIARGRRWTTPRQLQPSAAAASAAAAAAAAARLDPQRLPSRPCGSCKVVPMATTTTTTTRVVPCQWKKQTSPSLPSQSPLVRSEPNGCRSQRWFHGAAFTKSGVAETAPIQLHVNNPLSLRAASRNWSRRMGLAEMDAARVYLQTTFLSCTDWNDAHVVWQSLVRLGHPSLTDSRHHRHHHRQNSSPDNSNGEQPTSSPSFSTLSVALQLFLHLVRHCPPPLLQDQPLQRTVAAINPGLIEGMVCQWKRAALRKGSSCRTSSTGVAASAMGPWPSAVALARVLRALQSQAASHHHVARNYYTEATVHMILDVAIRQATPSLAPLVAQQLWTDLTTLSSSSSSSSPGTVSPSSQDTVSSSSSSSSFSDSFWYDDRPIDATRSVLYQPNGYTYNLFLWAWAESGSPVAEEHMTRLAAHRRQFHTSSVGNVDNDQHNRMWNHVWLRFYRVQGQLDHITALWSQIQASRRTENASLDSTSCLEVVYAYTNAGDVDSALPLLQSMVRSLVARARSTRHHQPTPPVARQAVLDTVKGLFHVLKAYTSHATNSNRIGPDLRNAKPCSHGKVNSNLPVVISRASAANGLHCLSELVALLQSYNLADAFSRGKWEV